MKYARVFLEHCPEDTTKLFIDYYTGAFKPKQKVLEVSPSSPPSIGTTAIQNLAALLPRSYSTASHVASPGASTNQKMVVRQSQAAESADPEPPQYDIPKPRTAFSSFVDHPEYFIRFLEACLGHGEVAEQDKADLYTTLFEMYLHFAKEEKGEEHDKWTAKARKLIDDGEVSMVSMGYCSRSSHISKRSQLTLPMYSYSRIFLTSETALPLYVRNKAYDLTSFVPIRPPTTRREPSKRSGSTVQVNLSYIRPHWHTLPPVLGRSKRQETSSKPF